MLRGRLCGRLKEDETDNENKRKEIPMEPTQEEIMSQDTHDVPDVAEAPAHEEDGGDL